ncbi:hypothetical protein [Streptomyces sp. NBC_00996]|uniref:hypothetical protein n=1 Tax=Streptomyces sp. NBC_00996 TaxID=2903710 RepID=UPI003865F9FB|nr:hypothetical protein OG390_42735 [Streptomyces sp. NBC_00996]
MACIAAQAASDALTPDLIACIPHLLGEVGTDPDAVAASLLHADGGDIGLLEGAAGVALALLGVRTDAGVADDPRRLVSLTDDRSIVLQFNREQQADEAALHGVLEQPGTEAWSGVKFEGQESPELMWLWLSCTLDDALSRMEVDRKAPAARKLSALFRPMAVAEKGSVAYLTLRKADTDQDGIQLYEAGAVGHGPAGKDLADRVAEEMSIWDRGFRGRDVAFEIQPLGSRSAAASSARLVASAGC